MEDGVIKIKSKRYPNQLKSIGEPPQALYYKGTWDEPLFDNCLAVVGARRMTRYGRQVTEMLVSEIAAAGITIVSGFMYGVDATAHEAAVRSGGRTVAVMPCGIGIIHPAHQEGLYRSVIDSGGLVLSEYPGEAGPQMWMYPRRNRIVAGLSQATLVVEAAQKSGSLITADLTLRYGRVLCAVPGPITSPLSAGTLAVIKNGARMVTCADDVLAVFGAQRKTGSGMHAGVARLSTQERSVVAALKDGPLDIDTLSRVIGATVADTGTMLSMLQLKGIVQEENRRYYVDHGFISADIRVEHDRHRR